MANGKQGRGKGAKLTGPASSLVAQNGNAQASQLDLERQQRQRLLASLPGVNDPAVWTSATTQAETDLDTCTLLLITKLKTDALSGARARSNTFNVTSGDVFKAYDDIVDPPVTEPSLWHEPMFGLGLAAFTGGAGALASVYSANGADPNKVTVWLSWAAVLLGVVLGAVGYDRTRQARKALAAKRAAKNQATSGQPVIN